MGGQVSLAQAVLKERVKLKEQIAKRERKRLQEEDPNKRKVLLLGAGECGKSTLFRQLIRLHADGFNDDQRLNCKGPIVENIVSGIWKLLVHCEKNGLELRPENQEAATFIKENYKKMQQISKENAARIESLWKDPALKEAYKLRATSQIADSCSYFLEKVQDFVVEEKY
jgi:hypothetical protein